MTEAAHRGTKVLSEEEGIRYSWDIGSELLIYSHSSSKWFVGQIMDIYIEFDNIQNKEWFIVKYNTTKKKTIQRFCKDIKPLPSGTHATSTSNSAASSGSVDLSVFTRITKPSSSPHQYHNCIAIQRLLLSLKYYSYLNIKNDTDNQDIFCHFMDEIYKHEINNDYRHLLQYHQTESKTLIKFARYNYGLNKCNATVCNSTATNMFKIGNQNKNNSVDDYMKVMDRLHFYFMHNHDSTPQNDEKDGKMSYSGSNVPMLDAKDPKK